MIEFKIIPLDLLDFNTGQIPGLPPNPREWTDLELKRLAKSMKNTPELVEARGCIVVPHEGRYVVLGGNLRLAAANFLKWRDIMCASVNTSFLTNLEPRSIRFRSAPKLQAMVQEGIDEFTKTLKKQLPKYSYPPHIITSSWVGILSRLGIEFCVPVAESEGISGLDSQKASGKAIYGKGYIVSDRVKAEREKAERWTLSDRELAIIHRLNQQYHEKE